jgi:hypothetical protein
MAYASVSVNNWFPSIIGVTNAWVDWSDFSVAYWGYLEEGSFLWSAPPLIQAGRHLGFGFRQLQDKPLGRLIQFLCGSLGVTRGRFLLMIRSAPDPRCPLRPPSWICFPSIRRQMPGLIDRFFVAYWGWLEEGSFRWSTPPFIQAAILDLVSVD